MSNYNYHTGAFKSDLTGKTYDSIEALRHEDRLEAMRRNIPTEEEAAFDNLPAATIKKLFEKAGQSEADNDIPLSPGYIYCQKCEARVRPDEPLMRRLDPNAIFDTALFNKLFQSCGATSGAEILG
jgi:hypothetical protein